MSALFYVQHKRSDEVLEAMSLHDGRLKVRAINAGAWIWLTKTAAKQYYPCEAPQTVPSAAVAAAVPSSPLIKVSKPTKEPRPMPKTSMIRLDKISLDEVRALPCQWDGCAAPPPSQASHRNKGKGMGIKSHDVTAALCQAHHTELDQGGKMSAEQGDYMWLKAFYRTVVALIKSNKERLVN